MRFVELTYTDGAKVWVNMAQIVAFEKREHDTHTRVTTNVCTFYVKEVPSTIMSYLVQ